MNGDTGKIVDMKQYGLYESASVKVRPGPCGVTSSLTICTFQIQILKTAVEVYPCESSCSCCLLTMPIGCPHATARRRRGTGHPKRARAARPSTRGDAG